jgi:hypothetical protein
MQEILLKGCGIAAESPEVRRDEDLQRIARTDVATLL